MFTSCRLLVFMSVWFVFYNSRILFSPRKREIFTRNKSSSHLNLNCKWPIYFDSTSKRLFYLNLTYSLKNYFIETKWYKGDSLPIHRGLCSENHQVRWGSLVLLFSNHCSHRLYLFNQVGRNDGGRGRLKSLVHKDNLERECPVTNWKPIYLPAQCLGIVKIENCLHKKIFLFPKMV